MAIHSKKLLNIFYKKSLIFKHVCRAKESPTQLCFKRRGSSIFAPKWFSKQLTNAAWHGISFQRNNPDSFLLNLLSFINETNNHLKRVENENAQQLPVTCLCTIFDNPLFNFFLLLFSFMILLVHFPLVFLFPKS